MSDPIIKDPRRSATPKQRQLILERCEYKCEVMCYAGVPVPHNMPIPSGSEPCGRKLNAGWVAGHYPILHAHGGRTALDNLRAECSVCAAITKVVDNKVAKKTNRMKRHHEEGRGTKRKGPKMKSRGFDKRFRKKLNGEVVPND